MRRRISVRISDVLSEQIKKVCDAYPDEFPNESQFVRTIISENISKYIKRIRGD